MKIQVVRLHTNYVQTSVQVQFSTRGFWHASQVGRSRPNLGAIFELETGQEWISTLSERINAFKKKRRFDVKGDRKQNNNAFKTQTNNSQTKQGLFYKEPRNLFNYSLFNQWSFSSKSSEHHISKTLKTREMKFRENVHPT